MSPEQAWKPVAAGGGMEARFNHGSCGGDRTGDTFADFAFGLEGDDRFLRRFTVARLERGLQGFQVFGVHFAPPLIDPHGAPVNEQCQHTRYGHEPEYGKGLIGLQRAHELRGGGAEGHLGEAGPAGRRAGHARVNRDGARRAVGNGEAIAEGGE